MNVLQGPNTYQSEVKLAVDLPNYKFGIKGIVDRIVEHDDYIHIIDLKTTNKTLADFKETVEYYNYWLQAAIYKKLVSVNDARPVKFSFVVIDKYQQVYEFEVSYDTMQIWTEKMNQMFGTAQYHYDTRQYDLPYEFATSKVIL
jgi:RecB family exonuclease